MRTRRVQTLGVLLLVALLTTGGCASSANREGRTLSVVDHVDINRYVGTWYEIASYPNSFQKGCTGTRATYTLREDGRIGVLNECYRGGLDGELTRASGTAKIVDPVTNARLKVTFFWPFYGDYWIIDLGKDYEYAVVGHPDYRYLWILSRSPRMEEGLYQAILQKIRALSYDTEKLVKTLQK